MLRYYKHVLFPLLLLSACQPPRSAEGVWVMGPIQNPRSSHQESFSASQWAASIQAGGELLLASDASVYGAAAEIPEAKLDGNWKGQNISFSWQSKNSRNMRLQSSFQGTYIPSRDVIEGTFRQDSQLGPISVSCSGEMTLQREKQ